MDLLWFKDMRNPLIISYITQSYNVIRNIASNKAIIRVEWFPTDNKEAMTPLSPLLKTPHTQLLLTKVWLIRTPLQFNSFRAALNEEMSHQLIVDVTCNIKKSNTINSWLKSNL